MMNIPISIFISSLSRAHMFPEIISVWEQVTKEGFEMDELSRNQYARVLLFVELRDEAEEVLRGCAVHRATRAVMDGY